MLGRGHGWDHLPLRAPPGADTIMRLFFAEEKLLIFTPRVSHFVRIARTIPRVFPFALNSFEFCFFFPTKMSLWTGSDFDNARGNFHDYLTELDTTENALSRRREANGNTNSRKNPTRLAPHESRSALEKKSRSAQGFKS
jgi:hypothetical protein